MTELLCEITDVIKNGDNLYFAVHSIQESKNYKIPENQLRKFNIGVGQRHYFRKEKNPNSKLSFLEYVRPEVPLKSTSHNKDYVVGSYYDFDIISIDSAVNKKGEPISIINVLDRNKNQISVLGLKWQKKDIWNYKTLKCEVERLSENGVPRLINKDFRHPFYEIGKEYEFEILDHKTKITANGEFDVYRLKGIDGCIHEVNMLPGQNLLAVMPETIQCKVVNITTHIRLFQTNIKDPFFVSFEKIVFDRDLEKKYFTSLLTNTENLDKNTIQLKDQYNSKSAFWVFTYANKILIRMFYESIERQDFKKAKEINRLVVDFEEWILTKGIITSFPNEEIKYSTKTKAKRSLDSAKLFDEILTILCSNPYDFLKEDAFFVNKNRLVEKVFHIINFSNIELVEPVLFYSRLNELLLNSDQVVGQDRYYLTKLLNHITLKKKKFLSEEENQNFSLSTFNVRSNSFNEREKKYLLWSFCEIKISDKLSLIEHKNITIGQLLRYYTKSVLEIQKKECLLFNSYKYFENYQSSELVQPFVFDEDLTVDFDLLETTITNNRSSNSCWDNLEFLFENKNSFIVQLPKKSKTGYEVEYSGLKGFLPYHHISDVTLKSYSFEDSSFSIEARCLAISRPFNFFIIEQVPNSKAFLNNGSELNARVGAVYEGVIKQTAKYGLFIKTPVGEGLVYKKEIFDFSWDTYKIDEYFKIGQKIKVVLKEILSENKLSFSFLLMKNIDILYYEDYVEQLLSFNTNEFFDYKSINAQDTFFERALIERAFCIEQFAVLQFEITRKLQNFQIAKQFYTNANHVRSFLINIYTSYFDILLKIKGALQNHSLNEINNIKLSAIEIKNKISQRTIETFPDSEKLIFFVDILSLFNEVNEDAFDMLFGFIKMYNVDRDHKDLRTISKITLANNLLASESNQDSDFMLKNLKLIYDYLSNGILSLEESIEDRNARELKEEVYYWQEKIKEDESETLEFKSSLFTPIVDDNLKGKIEMLNKIEPKSNKVAHELRRLKGDLTHKILIHSSLKTLVAFANSAGGTLLIGVDNNKNVLGLEKEYSSISPKLQYPNRDGYGLYFDDLVKNYIGDSFSSLMNRKFLKFPNGDVLIVTIKPSPSEVFLLKDDEGQDCEQLFIRNLSSTKELIGTELAKFVKNKHMEQLKSNMK